MSHATAKAPQIERGAAQPASVPRQRETGIVAWLRTWEQILIAEVLSAMERRRYD